MQPHLARRTGVELHRPRQHCPEQARRLVRGCHMRGLGRLRRRARR